MTKSFIGLFMLLAVAQAAPKKSVCVYDPAGANGDLFNLMKDYRAAALAWGVNLELRPYTTEKTAAEDFKAGQCDAALITGVRARAFHKFTASIEAMGALSSYKQLYKLIRSLSSKKAASRMKQGKYEVAALFPGGAVYLFVRDRKMKSLGDLAGKRIATLAFDEAAKVMVQRVGASMVSADIGTFSGMFNNGSVDVCYAPSYAYKALELYKGIGKKGGIIKLPLAQLSLQLILRAERFPDSYAQSSRSWAAKQFKRALKMTKEAEKEIPAKAWLAVDAAELSKYDEMFQDVRLRLRDKEKVYDKTMLKLLRKLRCKENPARAECVEKKE